MMRIAGELDPETAEPVVGAMQAIVDAGRRMDPFDHRTNGQRWADALGVLGERYLDSGTGPVVAGERPHAMVTVDVEALRSEEGSARLERGGVVPASVARRITCDASIARVVMGPRSEPLDLDDEPPWYRPPCGARSSCETADAVSRAVITLPPGQMRTTSCIGRPAAGLRCRI